MSNGLVVMTAVSMPSGVPHAGDTKCAPSSNFSDATLRRVVATSKPRDLERLAARITGLGRAGFGSAISTPVAATTPVALVFAITVTGRTTYQQIITDLQDFALLGSDELPECYDDVIQPGEVCDGSNNMGCGVGLDCIDCSTCVVTGQAETCKSRMIRDISKNLKKQLKCYARDAKAGNPVNPACLSAIFSLNDFWPKYTTPGSCPQTFPAPGFMQSLTDAVGSNLQGIITPLGTPGPQTKCAANKFKAASYRIVAKAKCHSKALAQLQPVNPTCLSNADTKYGTKYTSAENLGCDPGNVGNSLAIENTIDSYLNTDLLTNILP